MNKSLPSSQEIREKLRAMPLAQMADLGKRAGVPFPTLMKIRYGQTVSPQLDTARLIWPELSLDAETGRSDE